MGSDTGNKVYLLPLPVDSHILLLLYKQLYMAIKHQPRTFYTPHKHVRNTVLSLIFTSLHWQIQRRCQGYACAPGPIIFQFSCCLGGGGELAWTIGWRPQPSSEKSWIQHWSDALPPLLQLVTNANKVACKWMLVVTDFLTVPSMMLMQRNLFVKPGVRCNFVVSQLQTLILFRSESLTIVMYLHQETPICLTLKYTDGSHSYCLLRFVVLKRMYK